MATQKPTIVVIGGGMGGVETVASLANHLEDLKIANPSKSRCVDFESTIAET